MSSLNLSNAVLRGGASDCRSILLSRLMHNRSAGRFAYQLSFGITIGSKHWCCDSTVCHPLITGQTFQSARWWSRCLGPVRLKWEVDVGQLNYCWCYTSTNPLDHFVVVVVRCVYTETNRLPASPVMSLSTAAARMLLVLLITKFVFLKSLKLNFESGNSKSLPASLISI